MQMRAGGPSRTSAQSDQVACTDLLTAVDLDLAKVAVAGSPAVQMIHDDQVAIPTTLCPTGKSDHSTVGSVDRIAST